MSKEFMASIAAIGNRSPVEEALNELDARHVGAEETNWLREEMREISRFWAAVGV